MNTRNPPTPIDVNLQNHLIPLLADIQFPIISERLDIDSQSPSQTPIVPAPRPDSEEVGLDADFVRAGDDVTDNLLWRCKYEMR